MAFFSCLNFQAGLLVTHGETVFCIDIKSQTFSLWPIQKCFFFPLVHHEWLTIQRGANCTLAVSERLSICHSAQGNWAISQDRSLAFLITKLTNCYSRAELFSQKMLSRKLQIQIDQEITQLPCQHWQVLSIRKCDLKKIQDKLKCLISSWLQSFHLY